MNILNLSTTDKQGAGFFASYFNQLLNKNGHNSFLVVKDSHSANENLNIFQYPHKKLENIYNKFKRAMIRNRYVKSDFVEKYIFYNRFEQTSCYSCKSILELLPVKPDIIFIHWVSGFVNYKMVAELNKQTNAQIIILMIDNSPITGGCHYPWDCKGYMNECINCPAIINTKNDLAHKNYTFKKMYITGNEKILAFSQTDFIRLNSASLFKRNPKFSLIASVNEKKFNPITDKSKYIELKQRFKILTDKVLIFVAATFLEEERKGMKFLLKSLEILNKNDFFLLIAGNNTLDFESYNHKVLGYLNEDELINIFQIADVFACPTIEDSGPLMINQSIMSGTPVVAFKTGVAENIVIENKTGYLAEKEDYLEFANGLIKIINQTSSERAEMKQYCREYAIKTYSESVFVNKIEEILHSSCITSLA